MVGGRAQAQYPATPQTSPQVTSQSYPCACPFPQGYCAFPQGYCGLPTYACGTPMASQQGPSPQMPAPSMQSLTQGYAPAPYPAPKYYYPKPLGIPISSMPSSQSWVSPNSQLAPSKAGY